MGSWNSGSNYPTKYSYQFMDDGEEDNSDYVEEISKSIESDIKELGELNLTFDGVVDFLLEIDKVDIESGYYDSYRLKPDFSILAEDLTEDDSVVYEIEFIPSLLSELEGETYYEQVVSVLDETVKMTENQSKEVDEYFDKVDKIMNKYLTPYSVGWCSSPIVEE